MHVRTVLNAVAKTAARLCDAKDAVIFRVEGDQLCLVAKYGALPITRAVGKPFPISRGTPAGRAVVERRTIHVRDLSSAAGRGFPESAARAQGIRTVLSTPLLLGANPIGVIAIRRTKVRPFTAKQIALLKTFADQAAIAIENARLNVDLTEALDQQTATSEILRVISSSPTEVQAVFDAIARNAVRLCDASYSVIGRFDGQLLHLAALEHVRAEGVQAVRQLFPMRPSRETTTGRAILDRAVVHVPDVLEDPDYARPVALAIQNRSTLAVPMLRDGQPIGTISIGRLEPRPFTEQQIAQLKPYADQAVIAIENARLFQELQTRNRHLTEALDQQTATSEILRVISGSPTNVQTVFDAIAGASLKLCGAASGIVTTFDGELIHLSAQAHINPEGADALRRVYPVRPGRGLASGRAILTRAIVHIADVHADAEYELRDQARVADFQSVLAVPMLCDGRPIGSINVPSTI